MPQTPGQSNYLQKTLQASPTLTDDQRQGIWDTFHQSTSPEDFTTRVNKLGFMNDDAKQSLYELRYKPEKWMSPDGTPIPPSQQPPDRQPTIKGAAATPPPAPTGPSPAVAPPPPAKAAPSMIPTWDQISGTLYPQALGAMNRALNQPIQKTLFGTPSHAEQFAKTAIAQAPAAQGGVAGATADVKRVGLGNVAGLEDYIESPAGLAATFLTTATGGAAAPWLAGAYAANATQEALIAHQAYKANPTPENLQNLLASTAMVPLLAAGGLEGKALAPGEPGTESHGAVLDRAHAAKPEVISDVAAPEPTPVAKGAPGQMAMDFSQVPPPAAKEPETPIAIAPKPIVKEATSSTPIIGVHPTTAAAVQEVAEQMAAPEDLLEKGEKDKAFKPGEGAAAVGLVTEPPKVNVDQLRESYQSEIDKQKGIIRNPQATPEEKSIAQNQMETNKELLDKAITPPPPAKGPEPKPVEAVPVAKKPVGDLNSALNRAAAIKARLDSASDEAKASFADMHKGAVDDVRSIVRDKLNTGSPDDLRQMKADSTEASTRASAQADAIRQAVSDDKQNAMLKDQLTEMKKSGGGFRKATDPETGKAMIDPETGKPVGFKEQAEVGRYSRALLSDLMGQKARPGQGVDDIVPHEKPNGMTQQEHDQAQAFRLNERNSLKQEIAQKLEVARDTQDPTAMDAVKQKLDEFDQVTREYGRWPVSEAATGRRGAPEPTVGPKGEVISPEQFPTITKKKADAMFGRNLNKIPQHDEFLKLAAHKDELARLHSGISAAADTALTRRGERGGIGEKPDWIDSMPDVPSHERFRPGMRPQDVSPTRMSGEAVVNRAKEIGYDAWPATSDKPAGGVGWLSKDGKHFVSANNKPHYVVAGDLFPDVDAAGSAAKAMFENGWIRKLTTRGISHYEVSDLGSRTIDTLDMDMIRNGAHGHALYLDIRDPEAKFADSLRDKTWDIPAGWEDFGKEIAKAKAKGDLKLDDSGRLSPEAGRISLRTGTEMLTGSTIGAAAGFAVGGPIGGVAGWTLGAVTPALLRSKPVREAYANVRPIIRSLGIDTHDWLFGSKQEPPINAKMSDILDEQAKDLEGSSETFLSRVRQLPRDFQAKLIDRNSIMNDQKSKTNEFLNRLDPRGRFMRQGNPSIDDSNFVTLVDAAKNIRGEQSYQALKYNDIMSEASKAGAVNHLYEYMNLKGYKRLYDTLQEKLGNMNNDRQAAMQTLKNPNLSVRDRVQLEDQVADLTKQVDVQYNRLQRGEVAPKGYKEQEVAQNLQNMAQQLGPQKMQQIDAWAQRVFQMKSQVLDFYNDHGMLSDENYNLFKSRGPEYVPMQRIMSDMASNTERWYGKTDPAYVRQQKVVFELEGSERTNRNPMLTSLNSDREMISEAIRNKVITNYVEQARNDPKGVGTYFKEVAPDYKAKADEVLTGYYDKGVPHTVAVDKSVGEVLKGATPIVHDFTSRAMQRFAQTFRVGATGLNFPLSIMRFITNPMRMAILSDVKLGPKDLTLMHDSIARVWARSIKETIMKGPEWQEALRSGALSSGFQRNIDPESQLSLHTLDTTGKLKQIPSRIIDSVSAFNAALEDSNRLMSYTRLRNQGLSDKAVLHETARYGGSPDYSRRGDMGAAASMLSMFYNAEMQHITQTFDRVATKPGQVLVPLATVTAMVMMLAAHNNAQKDENGNPLMRQVPYAERERDFVILTGGTRPTTTGGTTPSRWRIRKPDVVAQYVNPLENIFNKVAGSEDRSGTQLALDAISHFVPVPGLHVQYDNNGNPITSAVGSAASSLNPIVRLPFEEAANRTIGEQSRPIVSKPGIDPTEQKGPTTSATAEAIGSITGISPQRMQHIMTGVTGGASNLITSVTDKMMPKQFQHPAIVGTSQATRQIPGIGPLIGRFSESSANQQDINLNERYHNKAQQVLQAYATFEDKKKTDPSGAMEYFQANKDDVIKGRMATKMQVELGKISKAQQMIQNRQDIPDQQKMESLKNLHATKQSIMRSFTGILEMPKAGGVQSTGAMGGKAQ